MAKSLEDPSFIEMVQVNLDDISLCEEVSQLRLVDPNQEDVEEQGRIASLIYGFIERLRTLLADFKKGEGLAEFAMIRKIELRSQTNQPFPFVLDEKKREKLLAKRRK